MLIFDLIRTDIPSPNSSEKLFLAFDRVAGWSLQRLNLIQQLCRWVFGAYSSTHLDTVQSAYKNHTYRFSDEDLRLISEKPALLQLYWIALYPVDIKEVCSNSSPLQGRLQALADVPFDYANNRVSPYLVLPSLPGYPAQFRISEVERERYRLSPRVNQLAAGVCSAVSRLYEERLCFNAAAAYAQRAAILAGATRLHYR